MPEFDVESRRTGGVQMFYISALVAILGGVGYQFFIKRVPVTLNPLVNVVAVYLATIVLCILLLPLFPLEGGLRSHLKQLSWLQLALAVSVAMIELGFLLMYRYGWNLSTGNLITSVFINVVLVVIGLSFLSERLSGINLLGVALSIAGVALISYRSQ
jgi:drug/metabolite transporter (DMT)-like permease